jgi:hypothetical protein
MMANSMCVVYKRMTNAWAPLLLAFVSLAMLPIPWVLFEFGPQNRAKSQYETVKA